MAIKILNLSVDVTTFRKLLLSFIEQPLESPEVAKMVTGLLVATEPHAGTKAVIIMQIHGELR